jgi:hypothetical protein
MDAEKTTPIFVEVMVFLISVLLPALIVYVKDHQNPGSSSVVN